MVLGSSISSFQEIHIAPYKSGGLLYLGVLCSGFVPGGDLVIP